MWQLAKRFGEQIEPFDNLEGPMLFECCNQGIHPKLVDRWEQFKNANLQWQGNRYEPFKPSACQSRVICAAFLEVCIFVVSQCHVCLTFIPYPIQDSSHARSPSALCSVDRDKH